VVQFKYLVGLSYEATCIYQIHNLSSYVHWILGRLDYIHFPIM